jgi:uncharacterized protein (DUF433 family)
MMNDRAIQSDMFAMTGEPVVAGTRFTMALILEKPATGETIERLIEAHPRQTNDVVYAAFDFAAKTSHADNHSLV